MKEFSTNPCPHFSACSGCTLGADLLNPPIWQKVLSFFRGKLEPRLITDGFPATRYKAKLAVRPGPKIGLFRKHSHEVISIPDCMVHHPSINQGVELIKNEIEAHRLPPYQETPPSGLLRYVQLFACRETGKIQLVLVLNATRMTPEIDAFCKSLLKNDLWHSLWVNFHPAASNRVLGDAWLKIAGEEFLFQTLNDHCIAFHPGAFSQSHLPLFERMLRTLDSWTAPEKKILELYAGVGAIGLALSDKAPRFDLVENNPFARLSFSRSKPPPHLHYHCLDASQALDLIGEDHLIVVDPPRKGLDARLLARLCSLKKSRLLYISCGFDSFQRDAEALLSAGWTFARAEGYLLFPGTNHVEILAQLTLDR